jgi:hypothetical protein
VSRRQEHCAELSERVRASSSAKKMRSRSRSPARHAGLHRQRLLEEGACRLSDELDELADVLVQDGQAGEGSKLQLTRSSAMAGFTVLAFPSE